MGGRRSGLLGLVVAGAALVVTVCGACGSTVTAVGGSPSGAVTSAPAAGTGAAADPTSTPGAGTSAPAGRYTVSGRVVATPDRPVQMCGDAAPLVDKPDIDPCTLGIEVTGVDLTRLQFRREYQGAVQGQASLVGRWDGRVLQVEQQTDPAPPPAGAVYSSPPCPPPADGWPTVAANDNLDSTAVAAFVEAHPGTKAAVSRPSDHEALWLVTTSDVAAAEAELRPAYGKGLCVVRSLYTQEDYQKAERAFLAGPATGVALGVVSYSNGRSVDPNGQRRVVVEVLYVTPELLELQRAQADGLVRLEPMLRPV